MYKTITAIIIFILAVELPAGAGQLLSDDAEAARNQLARQAGEAYRNKKWRDCLRYYDEYLEFWPVPIQGLSEDVSLQMGVSHLNLEDLPKARKYLEHVIHNLNNEYPKAYAFMAVLYAKSGLVAEMRASLLSAASLGFDVLEFMERSGVKEMADLVDDPAFIMEVLEKEKFVFTEPSFDPFECAVGTSDNSTDEIAFLSEKEQEKLLIEARVILDELENATCKEEYREEVVLALERRYERIKEIVAIEDNFRELRDEAGKVRNRLVKIEQSGKIREIRRRHFIGLGNGMLARMRYHLNSSDFENVRLWYDKLNRHIEARKSEFRDESRWLDGQGKELFAINVKREEFHKLDLEITGTVLMDPERQKFFIQKLTSLHTKLGLLQGQLWAKTSQAEIESLEREIVYYRERVRPKFIIINGFPYEPGQTLLGIPGLVLTALDEDFAYFEYRGEKLTLNLPKATSAASN